MKYASLVIAALIALTGAALKFTGIFPAGILPYFGLFAGTVGPFLITMLSPVLSTPFSDHVEHELARIFQVATFGLGVLPSVLTLNHAPAAANDWCAFAAAALAALGILFLPKAQPKTDGGALLVDKDKTSEGPKAAMLIPFLLIGTLFTSGCSFAQFKQDLSAAGTTCGAKLVNDVMQAIATGEAGIIADIVAAVEDAVCIYEAIGALAAKNGGQLSPPQQANAAKLMGAVKMKLAARHAAAQP